MLSKIVLAVVVINNCGSIINCKRQLDNQYQKENGQQIEEISTNNNISKPFKSFLKSINLKKKISLLEDEDQYDKYIIDYYNKDSECSLENINKAFNGNYYILK